MKYFIYTLIVIISIGCDYQITEISTPTTQCGMCTNTIIKALSEVNGVKDVKVNEIDQLVTIKYLNYKVSIDQLESAISKSGYQANDLQADPDAYSKLHYCCKLPEDRK